MKFTVEIESNSNLYSISRIHPNFPNDKIKLARLYTHLHETITSTLEESETLEPDESYRITFYFEYKEKEIEQAYSSKFIPIYFDEFIDRIMFMLNKLPIQE